MNRSLLIVLVIFLSGLHAVHAQELKNRMDSISYALGMDVGRNLERSGIQLNPQMIYQGLLAVMNNETGKQMSPETIQRMVALYQQEAQKMFNQRKQEEAQLNKLEGAEFLKQNAAKEGVVTLPSGLQYKVLVEGTGVSPTANNQVVVHYEGRLINGKVFDSSYKRGETISFGVTQVIKGWTEALQLMKTGAKWQLYIPSELAYGERGAGADIGPNSVLIFDVELFEVK